MIDKELKEELQRIKVGFPDAFINLNCELILNPEYNLYIMLENVIDVRQIKLKILAWLSYWCYQGFEVEEQQGMLTKMNKYLGSNFTKDEMRVIYSKFKPVRYSMFESRYYLFAFGGYDFGYLD